ncbi:MAG: hypothetical protein Q8S57_11125 [Methanoregula sp.]|nr:hypothetical protein [Methanoregula sp.]
MTKLTLENWIYNDDLEGLLFFAQTIREMVSRYTIDSYKAPVFNSHSICGEILDVINEIEQGFLHERGLDPLKEELIWNLQDDPVVRKLLGYRFAPIMDELKQADSPKKIQSIIKPIQNLIEINYLHEIHNQLIECVIFPKQKDKITQLSKIFISELVFDGYSQEYLHQEIMYFFFSNQKIHNINQLDAFFKKFSFKKENWDVYFRGDDNFSYLEKQDIFDNLEILDNKISPRKGFPAEIKFFEENEKYPLILFFKDIEALDPYDAREHCESILRHLNDLSGLNTHRTKLEWFSQSLVYSKSHFFNVIDDYSVMHKTKDSEICEVKSNIDELVSILIKLDSESMYLIWNSLSMHSGAIQSQRSENQLMNLWTSLETLLPAPPSSQKTRIVHFLNSFGPFLGRKYLQKLIKDLLNELRFELGEKLDGFLSKVPEGSSDFEKLSAVLSIKENKHLKDELCLQVGKNFLLRNKVHTLNKKLITKKRILETIETHNKRVRWQLQRIYRARNLIVHKGSKLLYLDQLVENLHSYYHSVFSLIQEIQYDYDNIDSLETIFKLVRIEHEAHLILLKNEGQSDCNKDNFQLLLFCNPK